jgi:hypothetical protein
MKEREKKNEIEVRCALKSDQQICLLNLNHR